MPIFNDDIENLTKYIQPPFADCIIFDPPYGIGNKKLSLKSRNWKKSDEDWDQFDSIEEQYQAYLKWLKIIHSSLKETGNLFVFGSYHNIYLCGEILQRQLGMRIVNSIVWDKINAMFNVTQSGLIEGTEYVIWATLSKDNYFDYEASKNFNAGKQLRNVWSSPLTPDHERVGHPHQKPIWIIQRLIEMGCPKDGLVVDPMCGSGTTAAACQGLTRRYVCLEKNPKYYQMAIDRLKNGETMFT